MTRRALIILCLAGLAGALFASPLTEAVSRGDAAAQAGRFAEAVRAYDDALSLADPSSQEILAGLLFKKARALRGAGDILVALETVEQAISYRPHRAFDEFRAELQERASGMVFESGQIRRALRTARGFAVAGGNPSMPSPSMSIWVGFEFDSAKLTPKGEHQAREMAEAMLSSEFTETRFLLVGHTDERGTPEYNLDLSRRRAEGLRAWFLDEFEFQSERLEAEGRGEEEPVARGDSEATHARNRRVELQLLNW